MAHGRGKMLGDLLLEPHRASANRAMMLHGLALTDPIRQFNDYGYTMCKHGLGHQLLDLGRPGAQAEVLGHQQSHRAGSPVRRPVAHGMTTA